MRVQVATKERALKKQHRCSPDRRSPAKPGEDGLADHRLNLKQQEGADENGQRKYGDLCHLEGFETRADGDLRWV